MFFDVALSGVNASSAQLATTGTNIANSGTAGFKTSQSLFSNVMSANMNAGTQMSTVSQLFSQGTITTSASPTDMAINGAGFFVVKDALTGQTTYTRDGQFTVNAAGNLVNTKGGQLVGSTGAPIAISNAPFPSLTSTAITTSQYLDPTTAAIPSTTTFNPAVPASYTTMSSVQAFDALGNAQTVNLYYAKAVAGNSTAGTGDVFNVFSTSGAPSSIQTLGSITMNPLTGGVMSFSPIVAPITATAANTTAVAVLNASIATDTTAAAGITTGAPSAATLAAYRAVYGSAAVAPASIAAAATPLAPLVTTGTAALMGTAGTATVAGSVAASTAAATANTAALASLTTANTAAFNAAAAVTAAGAAVTAAQTTAATTTLAALNTQYAAVYGSAVAPITVPVAAIVPPALVVTGTAAQMGTAGAAAAAVTLAAAATPTAVSAATPLSIGGVSIAGGAVGAPTVTINMAGVSTALQTVNSMTQNGYAAGALNAYTIGNDGKINATYSNNQTAVLGTVELANFRAPNGLQSLGNNYWAATAASGAATTGTPGSNGLGSLQGSAYESSNVDMTKELVNLMAAQRNYQANSQTIKAQDQLLQTMTSLR